MAHTPRRTRDQLRKSIGRNLIGHRLIDSTASSNDTAAGLIDDTLLGGDDNYNGWWIVLNSPQANRGSIRRISDYDSNTTRLVWLRPIPQATTAGTWYELWPPDYPPSIIHDYIDQSIQEARSRIYEPIEDYSLHADGAESRFPIPTTIDAVFQVQVRASAPSQAIHQTGELFDQTTDAQWTQSIDNHGPRHGIPSLRIDISAQAQNGDFISDSMGPIDLSPSTHVEGWMRSDCDLAAGDVKLHLNDGPAQADGSDAESLPMPTCHAGRWTYFLAALSNPWNDDAIDSIAIEYHANIRKCVLWFADIRAIDSKSATWRTLPPNSWSIDPASRRLTLTNAGRRTAGYAPLKIVGGTDPSPMPTDASTTAAPEEFVIARSTALAARAASGFAESAHAIAEHWDARARDAQDAFPLLTNVRRIA